MAKSRRQSNLTNDTIDSLIARIAALETGTVVATYYCSANFTSSATIPVNFDTKVIDNNNAVTTSATAWKFTVPQGKDGIYQVSGLFFTGVQLSVYKNGTAYQTISFDQGTYVVPAVVTLKLVAGDFIDLRNSSSSALTGGLQTGTQTASVTITRVGDA